jgi:hypothetical protein
MTSLLDANVGVALLRSATRWSRLDSTLPHHRPTRACVGSLPLNFGMGVLAARSRSPTISQSMP